MRSILFTGFSLLVLLSQAQNTDQDKAGRISPKELTIPASTVFDLMGVTPSQINRLSDIRDFKVDWSFKSWKLSPNLALQGQPIWEAFYNRKDLDRYQRASGFMRRLSTLDISVGTVQAEDNDRRIGVAGKLNLFRQKDPLLDTTLYTGLQQQYLEEKAQLEKALKELQQQLDTTASLLARPGIRSQIKATEEQLLGLKSKRSTEIANRAAVFAAEHWNASSLDIAFGRIYTYQTDSAGSLSRLRLNRNTGWGIWLNGGLGIGKRLLLTGLVRTTWYEEQVDFQLRNKQTGEEQEARAVAGNKIYSIGANLRYGGPLYTFFIEFLTERRALKTPVDALAEVFTAPSADLEVVGSSVKWTPLFPRTLSFGGDWRVSRNLMLNYGMRCIFTATGKLQTFTPVVSLACLMR